MFNPRYSLLALSIWFSIGSLSAQTNSYISIGKYQVHPTRIIAKYKNPDPVAAQSAVSILTTAGLSIKKHIDLVPGLVVLDSNPRVSLQSAGPANPQRQADELVARIAALQDTGLFEYVQPSYVHTLALVPNDASFVDDTLWGLRNTGKNGGVVGADIDAVRAWDITTGSTNVIVAVVDSGVRYTHHELAAQMWHNPGEASNGVDDDGNGWVDDIYGVNAVDGNGDPNDDNGHGTHVAGIIGAAANDGNAIVGVAWQVQIMACKAFDSSGVGLTDDTITCIDYAVAKGARIINASWSFSVLDQAQFDAVSAAQKKNVLVVAAAGNDGVNMDVNPIYPAAFNLNNVISVGAIDRFDQPAYFSNFGATNVDVFAPGVDILSSYNGSDDDYQVLAGTSMAAPHVSGVAALILAKFPKATLPELRERIISTAVRVPSLRQRAVSEGRVNAFRALSATSDGKMETAVYPPPGNFVLANSTVSFFVTVTDLKPVTNAVVKATVVSATTTNNITFLNDGKAPDAIAGDSTYSVDFLIPPAPGDLIFNFTITATNKTDFTDTVVYHIALHPPNDNFENGAKVPAIGGLLSGTNRFGSLQTGEPKHASVPSVDASVWWNWAPARSGKAIVDTAGSAFDTVLAVYTNTTLRTLRLVAAVDDVGINNSRKQGYVQFDAVAGITYHIAVAGANSSESGTVRLRVEPGGEPDNTAPGVIILQPSSGLVVTNSSPQIVISGVAFDPVPNASGVKEVFVQINGGLAARAAGTTNWASTNLLVQGLNSIRVLAADFAGNKSEFQTLSVRYAPSIAPNDFFNNAYPLTGTSGTVSGVSSNATREVGEPFHAGSDGGKSLWWSFVAPADGTLTLSTVNSDFDTLLAVYTGTRVNALTPVGSNDDFVDGSGYSHLVQAVQSGQLYHIAVDGYAGKSGTVRLDYSFASGNLARVEVQTPDGGTVTPASGFYAVNTKLVFTATPGVNQEFDHWDGTVFSTDNPLNLTVAGDTQVNAHFRTHQFSEDFESGSLGGSWQTSGNAGWIVQSTVVSRDRFAARSGSIGDGQTSILTLRTSGLPAGSASFDFKVSSEPNWDFLEFYLNGRRLDRWSGELGWLTYRFTMPAGDNVLQWRYTKDPINTAMGQDAAYIDNVDLPRPGTVVATAAQVHVERLGDGQVQVSIHGATLGSVLESSSDLVHWEAVSQVQSIGAAGSLTLDTGKLQTRFYRVITP